MRVPVNLKFISVKDLEKLGGGSEALAVGFCKQTTGPKLGLTIGVKGTKLSKLASALESKFRFEGAHGSSFYLADLSDKLRDDFITHPSLYAVGIGTPKDCHAESLLDLGGKIAQIVKRDKIESLDLYVDSFHHTTATTKDKEGPTDFAKRPQASGPANLESVLEFLATGIASGLYTFDEYKTKKAKENSSKKKGPLNLRLVSTKISAPQGNAIIDRVSKLLEAVYITRDLQNTPGGDLYPELLAKKAQNYGKVFGFSVNVFDEKRLKREGFGGILTVGRGSVNPPRMIVMEHNMSKKKAPLLVLIGKGVTFDTGGVSLKPAAGMEAMKMDMSGAASVIGAMTAIAKLKVPVRVLAIVPSAENMNSGSAVVPGDIYTAHGGKTVEVINTDAEGRLVLADALSYVKEFKPDCVVDVATLTGAVTIALGGAATGLMTNHFGALEAVKKASALAGERVWELPLYDVYAQDLKSNIADIKNVGASRHAGSQKGGAFLNFFIEDAYPWVHMDIAGSGMTPNEQGAHCPKDSGTAVPVRTLVALAENFEKLMN
jgi:leucyl aminopeptidase